VERPFVGRERYIGAGDRVKRRPKKAYTARRIGRLGTAYVRTLPDFIIIGAQKGGTTFLNQLLAQHPRIKAAFLKEVHYFDLNFDKGTNWYRSNFPVRMSNKDKCVTGEASPYYMFHPHAARRASAVVPNAKLIALLRNPIDRAYSHYQHQALRVKGEGQETLSFEQAVEAEEGRLRGEAERMLQDESYLSPNHRNYSYLSRGVYVDQLSAWSTFFDRTQMLVIKSEDLFDDTPGILRSMSDFLEIPRWAPEEYSISNKGKYTEAVSPDFRQMLGDFFRPHNLRLYEYLGVDLGW
jgi:hypothetical protein